MLVDETVVRFAQGLGRPIGDMNPTLLVRLLLQQRRDQCQWRGRCLHWRRRLAAPFALLEGGTAFG